MGRTAKPKRPSADSTKKAAAKTADQKARVASLVAVGRRAEAAQAARARAVLRTLRKHLVSLAQDFVEVGRLLTQLSDERLFVALGYDTFEAMLAGEKLPSRSHAFKLMRVATVFERSDVCEYGVERAMALIAYTRALPEGADPVRLLRDNAVIGGVPVREATTAHLERARRRVLASQGATTPQSAAATRRAKTEKAAMKRVTDALKSTNLPKATVAVSRAARHRDLENTRAAFVIEARGQEEKRRGGRVTVSDGPPRAPDARPCGGPGGRSELRLTVSRSAPHTP